MDLSGSCEGKPANLSFQLLIWEIRIVERGWAAKPAFLASFREITERKQADLER